MTFAIRILKSAERDLANALTWYRNQAAGLDDDFIAGFEQALAQIRQGPLRFAKRRREYRAVLMRQFPYTIYFRIVGDVIRIAAVLHQRQGPKARDRRLRAGR
jgi:plasmid stabilization system protein ParE